MISITIMKITKSLSYAFRGLLIVWREELNFKLEIIASSLLLLFMYLNDFSLAEFILVIIMVAFLLSAEVINTAIEDLCNKVEPNPDRIIAKVKDMSSAYVLIVGLASITVIIIVFIRHFM